MRTKLRLTVLAVALTAAPVTAEFRVGFAQTDITPPIGWRRAGNYTELIAPVSTTRRCPKRWSQWASRTR